MPPSDRRLSVLLLTRYDRKGASSRLRALDLVAPLAAHGIDGTPRPLFDDAYVEGRHAGLAASRTAAIGSLRRRVDVLRGRAAFDLVWIEKEALPWLPLGLERRLLRGTPYVVDMSDAWYLHYQRHRLPLVRLVLGRKLEGLVRNAAITFCGNAPIEAWASAAGARTMRLATAIDLSRYAPRGPATTGPFTLGWIGSPSTAPSLGLVAPLLARHTGDGVDLVLVGAGDHALPGVRATRFPWDAATEAAIVAGFSVGLVPLSDDGWDRAKSPYKLLQYMAAGIPVVATPNAATCEVIQHGVNGLLASTHDEWDNALTQLRADPALGRRLGAEARRTVEQRFSYEAVVPQLAAALWRSAGHVPR